MGTVLLLQYIQGGYRTPLAFCVVGNISFGGTTAHSFPSAAFIFFVIPKSRTLVHGWSRTLRGRFRLADVGADVDVTLDRLSGMKDVAGDSTGVPSPRGMTHGQKRITMRIYDKRCHNDLNVGW